MTSDEEALTALYAKRQDLLKLLAEVDASIKTAESQIQAKAIHSAVKLGGDECASGNADVDKVNHLITRCTKDASGLRDALKVVDACKHIQESVESGGDGNTSKLWFRNVFVHEVLARSLDISLDPNGSEFMQQVVSILSSGTVPANLRELEYDATPFAPEPRVSERMLLIKHIGADFVTVSCSISGSRVSQKVIDCLSTLEEFDVLAETLSPSVVELAKDINGNHILAKLISSSKLRNFSLDPNTSELTSQMHKNIYETIAENCIDICKNRQGCCIIQKCLQWAPEPYYSTIIETVLNNSLKLVQDPFGNYVVQFILDRHQDLGHGAGKNDNTNHTNQIIRQMLHHVAQLSCNKFSSNVIEKCLKTASPDVRQLLVDELTDPQVLPKLLTDSFANYVIQTAISTASDDGQFTQLRDSIMPLQDLLKNSPYGVKIEMKLSRRYRESTRKPWKKKENPAGNLTIMQGVPLPPQGLVQSDGGTIGHPVAFANIPQDMSSLFHQQQMMGTMPFVFQGQQVIGIPNSQPPFMSMFNGNGLHQEYH